MYDPSTFDFKGFAGAIAANFADMSKNHDKLLRVNISGDTLWDTYLASFPEGTNPIFRERTYHDGNYDKNFIRRVGNVVAIENGVIRTVWDTNAPSFPYDVVSSAMAEAVRKAAITGLFRMSDGTVGHERNFEVDESTGRRLTWDHFYSKVDRPHRTPDAATEIGKFNTKMAVFRRGLTTILPSAVEMVLDLINDNNLYRGEEVKDVVSSFQQVQKKFLALPEDKRDVFVWSQSPNTIRNSSIGTLLVDLSTDMDIEVAVAKYENKVSGTNYKRPKSLITKKQVELAWKKIEELNLRASLDRRHAKVSDLSVNDVLWVDRSVSPAMRDSVLDSLLSSTAPKAVGKTVDIIVDDFMKDVVPGAESIEVLFDAEHLPRLMSLTAPKEETEEKLFQWGNDFAWAYNGDVADSQIAKLVAAKGGNIKAPLRVSLAWKNYDDLDLHAHCPNGHVYFSEKKGILDVDENAGSGKTRTPVENLAWKSPRDGKYEIEVHNFAQREASDYGFTIEMEVNGAISTFSFPKFVPNKKTIRVISFTMNNGAISNLTVLDKDIISSSAPVDAWGLTTQKFAKVSTIVNSPNYWEGTGSNRGNKHLFFILENCLNPEPCRGMYNEFLRPELNEHRKVFEVLGGKTKVDYSPDQLSGIGFSSTQSAELVAKVTKNGAIRTYKVHF